jgi:hypothetical protein
MRALPVSKVLNAAITLDASLRLATHCCGSSFVIDKFFSDFGFGHLVCPGLDMIWFASQVGATDAPTPPYCGGRRRQRPLNRTRFPKDETRRLTVKFAATAP